jgi:hypothetical protein
VQVAAEDRERRAQRVAGGQADDGPSKRALADAENEAEAAAERRDVAVRAAQLGRDRLLDLADEREQEWTAAAAERVEATRQALADAVENVEDEAIALDELPAQLRTPLLFPAPAGSLLSLDNFRRREWGPAIETSGVATPARIYDLRSTFASNALAVGVTVFELARVMGRSR